MKRFQGVYPIVITPFHEDGSVDFDSQRRVVRFLIENGAHGLGLFANASEGYTLTGDERAKLFDIINREVDHRIPIIVSTGHTGTDIAVSLSREAQAAGADGLMVLPPYYFRPDAKGVAQYYQAISEAVNIPIMIQDAPLMTQVAMGSSLLASLARDIEHVEYVKIEAPPTAPKVTEVVSVAGDSLGIFGGLNGNFFIEELGRGAIGIMPGSDMVAMFVRVWDLYQQGRIQDARDEFSYSLPMIRYELQPGLGVSVMKHNLQTSGIIDSSRVRHPTRFLDQSGLNEVEELRLGLDRSRQFSKAAR